MPDERPRRPFEILLVEDNPADARLVVEGLRMSTPRHRLRVVGDGREALAILRRQSPHARAPRPDLIILDLGLLPLMGGLEVLSQVKSDPELRRIPLVVLTASEDEPDIQAGSGLHANCYIVKPLDTEEFSGRMETMGRVWFDTATLPPR